MSDVSPPVDAQVAVTSEVDSKPAVSEKVVPVGESIRYRRRAQQAEKRAEQLEQQLHETQAQVERQLEQLASAEAQRDEASERVSQLEHRRCLERTLLSYGVADLEAGVLLLEKEASLSADCDAPAIEAAVEKLLLNRPHLCARASGSLPSSTASGKRRTAPQAELVRTAERAARTGDRRDIAQYLRLRRQLSPR